MRNLNKDQLITLFITAAVIIGLLIFEAAIIVEADTINSNTYINYIWNSCTDEERMDLPMEYQAYICGMSLYEFEYMARTIEAESDRSGNLEGKIMIAATIFNRKTDHRFPNTISGVLNESGQFETTYNGWCSISSTRSSRWAIVEAQRRLQSGLIPNNVLYFNCVGYNRSWQYGYFGGNYFMCA